MGTGERKRRLRKDVGMIFFRYPRGSDVTIFDEEAFGARLFFPRRDFTPPPPGAEDRALEVDGGRLHLRVHAAGEARATVLLFHGNGEVVSDYDEAAPTFRAAGGALAVAEYRGYGRAEGRPSLRNLIEDARAYLSLLGDAGRPLVVMGRSLGCAAAAELYAEDAARALVWESGFVELRGLVARRGLPVPASFDAETAAVFDPLPKLERGSRPLLVLHGAEDDLIPSREAEAAFAAARTQVKSLVLVPERGHNDLMRASLYWDALRAFLAEID